MVSFLVQSQYVVGSIMLWIWKRMVRVFFLFNVFIGSQLLYFIFDFIEVLYIFDDGSEDVGVSVGRIKVLDFEDLGYILFIFFYQVVG